MSSAARPAKKKRRKRSPRLLDWYRVDTTPRIRRLLGTAAALVLAGSLIGAVSLARMRADGGLPSRAASTLLRTPAEPSGIEESARADEVLALGVLALALVVSGGATAIYGLMRELSEERWLALRTDGLVINETGREKRAPWSAIEGVRMEGSVLVVELTSGDTWSIRHRFAGTTRAELGKRIAQVRRRALHGLLRPS